MCDGGLDSVSGEYFDVSFAMFISSTAACKGGDKECALFLCIANKKLIFDSHSSEETFPSTKAPKLLLDRRGRDAGFLVKVRDSECSQETISAGTRRILKFCGVWAGKRVEKSEVSCCVDK